MTHCDSCSADRRFIDWNGDCSECAKSNPLERAAIELLRQSTLRGIDAWADLDDDRRNHYRSIANAMLRAAVVERELAQHVGTIAAQTVTVHLLGTDDTK